MLQHEANRQKRNRTTEQATSAARVQRSSVTARAPQLATGVAVCLSVCLSSLDGHRQLSSNPARLFSTLRVFSSRHRFACRGCHAARPPQTSFRHFLFIFLPLLHSTRATPVPPFVRQRQRQNAHTHRSSARPVLFWPVLSLSMLDPSPIVAAESLNAPIRNFWLAPSQFCHYLQPAATFSSIQPAAVHVMSTNIENWGALAAASDLTIHEDGQVAQLRLKLLHLYLVTW